MQAALTNVCGLKQAARADRKPAKDPRFKEIQDEEEQVCGP